MVEGDGIGLGGGGRWDSVRWWRGWGRVVEGVG